MRYNAVKNPTRMGVFSQYMCPQSAERYASVARFVGLDACEVVRAGEGDDADDDAVNAFLVEALIDEVEALRERLGVPATLIAYFEEQQLAQKGTQVPITREAIAAKLDGLALAAFDDQCTGTNPRYRPTSSQDSPLPVFHQWRRPSPSHLALAFSFPAHVQRTSRSIRIWR